MNNDLKFWQDQAEEIDSLIRIRYIMIEHITLVEQVEFYREKANIMEEWKDKVEFQRQGLEKQVGEIEFQRQGLEKQVGELEAQRRNLELELEKANSLIVNMPWRIFIKEKFGTGV